MQCFSLAFIENLLIWLVVIIGIVAIVQLVIPKLMSLVGASPDGGIVFQIIRIVVWVVLAIAIIFFVFDLLSCLLGSGGGFGRLR